MCTVRIPLNSRKYPGLYALVDEADASHVSEYSWHPSHCEGKVYAEAYAGGGRANTKMIRMHRFVMNASHGVQVDHKNGNGLDNRRSNLRLSNQSQNMANVKKYRGVSRYKGVHWDVTRDKWMARVRISGVIKNLGRFDCEEDAARAYDVAAYGEFGEFAVLNFSDEARDPAGIGFIRAEMTEGEA